jgi:phosphoserine phosphatase RsbU/P
VRATGQGHRVTVASGGHPLPIKVTAGGQARAIGRSGALLGVLAEPPLHDASTELRPGDSLALFTDGIVEARRVRDFFGEQRLTALLVTHRDLPAPQLAQRVVDEVVDFQAGMPRDDIALVVLKVPPAA